MAPKKTFLTTREFASQSGRTVDQVTRLLREKQLKGHKKAGRWMIPADQLQASREVKEPIAQPAPDKPTASSPASQTLSVAEFSAKTFLTEAGVVQWLKRGRLRGQQAAGGEWRVDTTSLELPGIQHLLRR
jgi:hypothetical protein